MGLLLAVVMGRDVYGAQGRDDRVGVDPGGGGHDAGLPVRVPGRSSGRPGPDLRVGGESLAAGIIFTMPALIVMGTWTEFDFWTATGVAFTGGLLGSC